MIHRYSNCQFRLPLTALSYWIVGIGNIGDHTTFLTWNLIPIYYGLKHLTVEILLDYQRSDRDQKITCHHKQTENNLVATLGARDAVRSLEALNPPSEFFPNAVTATERSLVIISKRKTFRSPLLETETQSAAEKRCTRCRESYISFLLFQ